MKKFITVVAVLALLGGGLALYLKATTPHESAGVRVPLTAAQRELLASVPATADTFAFIPTAAVFRAKVIANPVTRDPVLAWAEDQQLPRSWMIADADLVVWRAGKRLSYATRLDPLRAALVRVYLMLGSGLDARVQSGTFLINAGAGAPIGAQRVEQILSVANGLGPADAIVIQQARGDAFPPVVRPSVTLVNIGAKTIDTISVARSTQPLFTDVRSAQSARFPAHAIIAATFQRPPRMVSDLDRLLIVRLSRLLEDGGSIAIYDVNTGTLLPRPNGLIVAKATLDNLAAVSKITDIVATFGEVRQSGDEIFLSFDRNSMTQYTADSPVAAPWPSNDWSARLDPKRALPILDRLAGNTGLRIAAPRIYRAARDLRGWMAPLAASDAVFAAHGVNGSREEFRVRIEAK